MPINEFIQHLIRLEVKHGKNTRVMCNHGDMAMPEFIGPEDGCPAYISIESE